MSTVNDINLLCNAGKSVLSSLHSSSIKYGLDDTEYLPAVKAAICGIKSQAILLNLPRGTINYIIKEMIEHSKVSYLDFWLSNKKTTDDSDDQRKIASEEGVYYFDYIYENEKLPMESNIDQAHRR